MCDVETSDGVLDRVQDLVWTRELPGPQLQDLVWTGVLSGTQQTRIE